MNSMAADLFLKNRSSIVIALLTWMFTCSITHAKADSCGYPTKVRDGLHPYQYFSLAKVYLSDFDIEKAKICIDKLKTARPNSSENLKLVQILNDCYMPKYPVPEKAIEQLRKALQEFKTKRNSVLMQEIRHELLSKYPKFEWTYFLINTDGQVDTELKKILAINPNNVEALVRLANSYKENNLEKRLAFAKRAKELDPSRADIDFSEFKRTEVRIDPDHDRKVAEYAKTHREVKLVEKAYKFIDKEGKTVFYEGPNVSTAKHFSDGLLKVEIKHDSRQYWNKSGDLVFDIDTTEALDSSQGLCPVLLQTDSHRSRWGFVNHEGKTAIPPKYFETLGFYEGIAAVKVEVGMQNQFRSKSMWGFINKKGELVVEPIYDHCFSFSEGLAAVVVNRKVGFINREGFFVIPPKFDGARPFSEGLANVVFWDEVKQIIFDRYVKPDGEIAFSINYKVEKERPFKEVLKRSKYLCANQYDIQSPEKISYRRFEFHDGLTARQELVKPGVWKTGFRCKTGPFTIQPEFDLAEAFNEGLAKTKVGNKFGYIDTKGKWAIPAKYLEASDFSEGLAAVSTNGQTWGYVDKNGKKVIDEIFLEANSFNDGLAKVGVAK